MFCPKCATQNPDGGSFCRACGANISLIPQALSGQLVQHGPVDNSRAARRARRRDSEPSLESSLKSLFMGIAFVIIAIAVSRTPGGAFWWFYMLIPAFLSMAKGLSQLLRLKDRERNPELNGAPPFQQSMPDRGSWGTQKGVDAPGTGELMPPVASVTEGTTRHLGVEAPTRHFDAEHK
jgi:hypothetical protein